MPVDERDRRALVRAATDSWGEEVAATLSELLPPTGSRPATQADVEGVLVALDAMDERFEGRFELMERRMELMEGLLDRVDGRLDQVDGRLDQVDGRLDRVEGHLDRVEGRLDQVDGRLDRVEGRLDRVEGRLDRVEGRLDRVEGSLGRVEEGVAGLRGDVQTLAERIDGIVHQVSADAERRFTDLVTSQTRSLMLSLFGTVVVIAALAFGLR